jgi:purine-cytosine permease-like protein
VPPPPPPGYGGATAGGPGYQYAPRTEGTAIGAFVVALVGIFLCGVVTGIIALVMANNAKQKIDASNGQLTGTGFVTAARVIAIVSIVLSILSIVILAGR